MGSTLVNMLGGIGGPQVDIVLFMTTKETMSVDLRTISTLAEIGNVIPLIAKSDCLDEEQILEMREEITTFLSSSPARVFSFAHSDEQVAKINSPYTVSSALSPDMETMDASLLMSSEYIQPLVSSQLHYLVRSLFDKDTILYLKHTSAKKLVSWKSKHPAPLIAPNRTPSASPRPSTIGSPALTSVSASGVLVPYASDISLTTSNSYTLARVADHTQREERLAQVRLAKWATDLQESLNRERERYEKIARGERALWLVERMGEELRDGHLQSLEKSPFRSKNADYELPSYANSAFAMNDPMGLLKWNDDIQTRGWVALQVCGSFGVIGGLAFWLAKTWGFNNYAQSIADQWKW
ncbi:putative heat shock protein [Phaeomoniella chlamydospora]|uniref:Putative heat shock protein n=1 Tax=Phaeomoniella chlamydospora TaxID=158046 RepID=A0A0G2G6L8_PHACM|nr:putative heat shock protein [Phaeomoniella chlamydospora]